MSLANFIIFGDLRLTVTLAGAVAVWLVATHSYRLAYYWIVAFVSAMGAVVGSKILYLAWGIQVDSVEFKAVSGHATGAAAVLPIALHLLAMGFSHQTQNHGFMAGGILSIAVAASLVLSNEHTVSETLIGWCFGVLASGFTWTRLRNTVIPVSIRGVSAVVASTIAFAACMHVVPAGWWLIKIARLLSGDQQLQIWNND